LTFLLTFAFRAVRPDGSMDSGVVDAADRDAAAALLGARGLFPIDLAVDDTAKHRLRVGPEELALGFRALCTLLAAGLPISRAMPLLAESAPGPWRRALPDLQRRIEQGEALSDALERSALPIPAHTVGIIRAGEAGSGLAAAVERAAEGLEERAQTRSELRKALAYPLLLLVTGSACVALLVGFVLPRFAGLLVETDQALPATTRFVLHLGGLGQPGLLLLLVLGFTGAVGWHASMSRPGFLPWWHGLLLRLPLIGPIRRAAASANACSALAALVESGVPIATALPEAARASGDAEIERRLRSVRERIIVGESFSVALAAEGAMTNQVVRLVRVGEETGELPAMLEHAARMGSATALRRVQTMVRFVEPGMILAFGGVVMLIAAALLQAMYGLRPVP
jgi:general secretion pathway protein F